jgi:iron complex outermembrane receptor protein
MKKQPGKKFVLRLFAGFTKKVLISRYGAGRIRQGFLFRLSSGCSEMALYLIPFIMFAAVSLPSSGQPLPVGSDDDSLTSSMNRITVADRSPGNTRNTSIKSEDFNRGLILNAEGLVAGRFQGLLSRMEDGSPAAGYSLESLRNSSFYSSLSPLLVVDGVPIIVTSQMLNPHDIESITWLNGSQAAGYGSLGRNGILLIETGKGREGFHVSYSGQVALSTVKKYGVLTGDQFREALLKLYNDDPEILALAGSANTDWQDEIYRAAISHDHHLEVSGKAGNLPFRFSAGQTFAQGTIRSSYYRKTSFTGRIDPSLLDDNLNISLIAAATTGNESSPGSRYLPYYAAVADPTSPVYVNNDPAQGYTAGSMFLNPVSMLESNENLSKPKQMSVILNADYKPDLLPGLSIGLKGAAIGYSDETSEIINPGGALPIVNGYITTQDESLKTRSLDLSAGYSIPVKRIDSEIELKAGYFMHWFGSEVKEMTTDYVNPDLIFENYRSTLEISKNSVYGEFNFSVSGRYFITAVLREDSFSEFTPDNRSVLSPSVTAEWNIAGESFFPSDGIINDLALNFTLGSAGTGSLYRSFTTDPSPDLRPESAQYFISGLRMALLENSVHLSVNAFINRNQNMLNEINIPSGSNFSATLLFNAGNVDNKGIELRADANLFTGKAFRWDAALHCTLRKNSIKNLGRGINSIRAGSVPLIPFAYVLIQETEMPVNSFYLLKQVYNEEDIPIQGLYVDYNNNGVPDFDDRYIGPSADPEFAAGIWSSLKYHNWELSFSASSLAGNWCYNVESVFGNYGSMIPNGTLRNISSLVYESGFTEMVPYSDYHMENGSFIRLDFVSLGHTFRNVSGKNAELRLEATLQNAFLISGYRGAEPDNYDGLSGYTWPRPRTTSLNISIGF